MQRFLTAILTTASLVVFQPTVEAQNIADLSIDESVSAQSWRALEESPSVISLSTLEIEDAEQETLVSAYKRFKKSGCEWGFDVSSDNSFACGSDYLSVVGFIAKSGS